MRTGTIAVVDDDAAVRDSAAFLLEMAGFTVAKFESAAAFSKHAAGNIDCVLLDHHMPNETGLELAERLARQGQLLPTLLITGTPSSQISKRPAQLGVQVLEKPPNEADMMLFISSVIK
jgi:two-component system response regulator FixJ